MQFLRYASRLPWYDGAVAAAIHRIREDAEDPPAPAGPQFPGVPQSSGVPQPPQTIEASPLNLLTNPLLSQFIEYG